LPRKKGRGDVRGVDEESQSYRRRVKKRIRGAETHGSSKSDKKGRANSLHIILDPLPRGVDGRKEHCGFFLALFSTIFSVVCP
jgi:hypothetical protein